MPIIRVDEDVYSWLKTQAIPFEDTPNSVLRRLAGFDSNKIQLKESKTKEVNFEKLEGGKKKMALLNNKGSRLSGKYLARLWDVDVVHALYHKDGTFYENIRDFPGALFDSNGYVIFKSEKEYSNCSYLNQGLKLNVHKGIWSIPGYVRMR